MNSDIKKNLVKPNNALFLMWIKLSTIVIYNFVTMLTQIENIFSKNMVISTMAIVGTLLLVSTIINNSSSNMSVNAQVQQQQSSKEAPEKGTVFCFQRKE